MSKNTINSKTIARQKRAAQKRRLIHFRLPLGISPHDSSQDADRRRYDLHVAMMRINPSGFRIVGTKRGVTKPSGKNRLTELARSGYLGDVDTMSMIAEGANTFRQLFNINKEVRA